MCPCSQFVAGHLPFEPHSDSVIQLQANQFCEILSPMCPSSDREGYRCQKGLAKKLTMLPLLLQKSFSRPSWTAIQESDFLALSLNAPIKVMPHYPLSGHMRGHLTAIEPK